MFDGAANEFESSDIYGRFRTDFGLNPEPTSNPGLISEIVNTADIGAVIEPTDITERVMADLERLKDIAVPAQTIYGSVENVQRRIALDLARFKPKNKLHAGLMLAAVASIAVGLYLTFSGWHSDQIAQAQATRLTNQASSGTGAANVPSSVKPSANAVNYYTVPSDHPRYVDIPKLGVHARTFFMGVLADGSLMAPSNIYDAGWYKQSALPGQNGAMLIDGHISNWQAHGVFYGLNQLRAGDAINITRGDGKVFKYQVVKTQVYDADNVNMSSLLVSANTAKPGLNLISCSGDVIPGTNEFNKRIVVYAVLN